MDEVSACCVLAQPAKLCCIQLFFCFDSFDEATVLTKHLFIKSCMFETQPFLVTSDFGHAVQSRQCCHAQVTCILLSKCMQDSCDGLRLVPSHFAATQVDAALDESNQALVAMLIKVSHDQHDTAYATAAAAGKRFAMLH